MENQEQKQPDVNTSQTGQPPEPASPQPPEPTGPQPPEPTGPQPPEPVTPGVRPYEPAKSQTTKVQETVDRNLAEQAARRKLTDEVIAKRKQTAAKADTAILPAVTPENNIEVKQKTEPVVAATPEPAEPCTGQPENPVEAAAIEYGEKAAAAILAEVKKSADARELREIAMHNAGMDAMKEQVAQVQAMCDILSDIGGSMKDIADSLKGMEVEYCSKG